MEINTNLTQSNIEAIGKLALIEAQERAILESSESVELNNGEFLNKKEQLAFFEQIYKLAVLKGACEQVGKFKSLYETDGFYGAWSILLGNFNWLSNRNILSKEKHWLPKSVSIGTTYRKNGQVWVTCSYKDGKRDGEYVVYHSNGQIWVTCSYKDGKRDGEYVVYHSNGQVFIKTSYKDGKLDGKYVEYHSNGQAWETCSYKDGELDGEYVKYYSNGQVFIKSSYKDGKLDGEYFRYHSNGQVYETCSYKDDNLV